MNSIIYWVICIGLFVYKMILQYRQTKRFPLVLGQSESWQSISLEWGFVLFFEVWSIGLFNVGLDLQWTWLQMSPLFQFITFPKFGWFLLSIGLTLFIRTLLVMGSSWRVGIDSKTPGKLVTTGIFQHTRNPIFVFLLLWVWGTFFIYGTIFFLSAAIILTVGLHLQILSEEKFLISHYAATYLNYKNQIPRYFSVDMFFAGMIIWNTLTELILLPLYVLMTENIGYCIDVKLIGISLSLIGIYFLFKKPNLGALILVLTHLPWIAYNFWLDYKYKLPYPLLDDRITILVVVSYTLIKLRKWLKNKCIYD